MTDHPQSFRPSTQAAYALSYLIKRERRAEQRDETLKAASAVDILNQMVVSGARELHRHEHANDQNGAACEICKALAPELPPTRAIIRRRKP